jgi:hypothetical protein
MMYRYVPKRGDGLKTEALLAISLLFATPLMFRYVKIYRPEFLVTALGFASFLFVLRSVERKSILHASLAAITAGLAALAHLNGVIFIIAGLGALLLEKRGKEAAVFLPLSLAVAALYFYDIAGNQELFRRQFFNDFVVERTDYGILAPLRRLFAEHERYFRTPEIIGISVLFVLTMPLAFRKRIRENGFFYRYLLLLFLALGLVSKSITTKYAIPLLPFLALGIASAVSPRLRRETGINRIYGAVLALFILAHAGYGLFYGGKNAFTGKSFLAKENALIASGMERGVRVLAPGRFIFDEMDHFTIRDIHAARYRIMHEQKRDFNPTSLCEYALDNRFDYIVLDREYRDFGKIDPEKIFPPVWGYEAVKEYTDGTLLIRKFNPQKSP